MASGNWPFGEHRYNLATTPGAGRTAGSAFKVFTLAAALASGIPPTKVYSGSSPKSVPACGGGETWTLRNAEPSGGGSYPLWLATTFSVNTVFAQVIDEVGPKAVARTAHRMGIDCPLTPVCPLTLGTSAVSPLEMTAGFGTGTAANIGRPVAGKTGTGQEYQDAWFLGYIPQLATGVWVGHAQAEIPMPYVPGYGRGFGRVLAAPIWHDFMLAATAGMPVLDFPPPPIPLFRPAHEPEPTPTPSPRPSERPGPGPSPGGDGNGD
jgi:penicillin-binding protein 1A